MAASTSPVTDRSARYICKSSRSCVGVEPTKEPCPWTVDQMVSAATMPDAVAEPRTPNRSAAQMMSGKMAYSSPVGGRSNAAVRPTRLTSSTPASAARAGGHRVRGARSEEHTSELQSLAYLVCRLLLEKKKLVRTPREQRYRDLPHQPR